ncbi:MAG TPA: ABC transporter permease [Terriglobales bacterium]|nr:ABC transporter permease [Terriglobales bacterium]
MIAEKVIAVLKKDAITAVRYRNGFVLSSLAQVAQLATFYYLARAVGPQFRPEGMPYFLFLLIGTGFYTFLLSGIHSFLKTVQDSQQTGTLEVLLTTATPAAVLVSLGALSAFGEGLLQFALYIGAGIFLFAPAMHFSAIACGLAFLLSILSAFGIGLIAAGLQISIHKGSAVLWLLGSGAWLMSGTLFPVTTLPKPVQFVSYLIPFTHSLAAMRLALLDGSFRAAAHEVEILTVFALFLVPAGILFFSQMVRHARQNGRLSFY